MALVGFHAQNHPQQATRDDVDDRATTADVFGPLDERFGPFTVDVAAAEQTWWQELVEPYRDRPGSPLRTEFIPGRLRFIKPGQTAIGANERPPFGCCLLIWEHTGPTPQPSLFGNPT